MFCLALAALAITTPVPAQPVAAEPPSQSALPPLSEPVIEVAVFRVAPVAAAPFDIRAKGVAPRDTASAAVTAKNGEREAELRVQKGELWQNLLSRVAAALSANLPESAVQVRLDGLPLLLPGKYLRARARAGRVAEIDYLVSADEAYAMQLSATA
jgi:hypothetical protein